MLKVKKLKRTEFWFLSVRFSFLHLKLRIMGLFDLGILHIFSKFWRKCLFPCLWLSLWFLKLRIMGRLCLGPLVLKLFSKVKVAVNSIPVRFKKPRKPVLWHWSIHDTLRLCPVKCSLSDWPVCVFWHVLFVVCLCLFSSLVLVSLSKVCNQWSSVCVCVCNQFWMFGKSQTGKDT